MKKILFFACGIALACNLISCSDTKTYAELVADEKEHINTWISDNPYNIDFDNISSKDEEWVKNVATYVLTDSLHPEQCGIELHKWYRITEGDFKRLYFRINSWGNDGLDDVRKAGNTPTDEQYLSAMRNKKKFNSGHNVLVRYDSLFILSSFDYDPDNLDDNIKSDNLDPNSFLICYNWNTSYYASTYYGTYYGSNSSYECTSGGVGFPIRFLWEGGDASIICPFSLVEQALQSYYYTLYYGSIKYTKPTYLPK